MLHFLQAPFYRQAEVKFDLKKKLNRAFTIKTFLLILGLPLRIFTRKELYRNYYGSLLNLPGAESRRLDKLNANLEITRLLEGTEPCMIARFGSGEVEAMLRIERYKQMNTIEAAYEFIISGGKESWSEENWEGLRLNAGFFSVNRGLLEQFLAEMIEACQHVDLLGSWTKPESRYTNNLSNALITKLENLEPYFCNEPWSACLKGKRVLVVHPYAELIRDQYGKHRKQIFPNSTCLPEFDLICLKAVQTIAGKHDSRFGNWFDALYWMEDESMTLDFDVALIGCGAYGFPLAARLKKRGKKVVHLGGALQILFGIKGTRWDEKKEFTAMYNQFWTRPGAQEKPYNFRTIEGGCYW